MMKCILLIFSILMCLEMVVNAQEKLPLTNDTIICIVDTTNCFTQFRENPFEKNRCYHWQVGIKGHYYDNTEDEDLAGIIFSTDFRNNSWVKGDSIISIPTNNIDERFTVVTDNWLNEQADLYFIRGKVGITRRSNYNFLIFKEDLINNENGIVSAHRVLFGCNSFQN